MKTITDFIQQGYGVRMRIPLQCTASSDYRLDLPATDDYTVFQGFVDPVGAADHFSFSHMRSAAVAELRAARAEGKAMMATQDDYELPIHARETRTEYGREIPLLNGMTREKQIHEVASPTLDAVARDLGHDPKAVWAIQPPAADHGDATLFILAPGMGPVAATPPGSIKDEGRSICIGGIRIPKR